MHTQPHFDPALPSISLLFSNYLLYLTQATAIPPPQSLRVHLGGSLSLSLPHFLSLTQSQSHRERGAESGVVGLDLALLWCFEVCVDERKWSTVFRQAPNEGIKKLRWPLPMLTSQAYNKRRACVRARA